VMRWICKCWWMILCNTEYLLSSINPKNNSNGIDESLKLYLFFWYNCATEFDFRSLDVFRLPIELRSSWWSGSNSSMYLLKKCDADYGREREYILV
jgi:hypothetical protein